jgi:hypothetical protein
METPHFYIALFAHLTFLILGFGAVLVIDTFGLLMLLKKQTLDQVKKTASVTQPLIWVGWTGMVVSGANLIYLKGYVDSLTAIKIFLVLMIGFNGLFLHNIKKALEHFKHDSDIPRLWRFRIFFASLISQLGWWGALVIGFVHRHIEHNIAWPASPYPYIFSLLGILALIAVAGELVFKPKNQDQSRL